MSDAPGPAKADSTTADDVLAEYLQRVDAGEDVDREEFVAAHPDVADALRSYFAAADEVDRVAGPTVGETMVGAADENDTAVSLAPQGAGADGKLPQEFGRYRVIRTLGHGAMGAVYLAEDSQLDRQVALKVPKFSGKEREELLVRFNREAKAAATLSHPNVCPVFDVGEIDGTHFISMGYIEGRPLSDFVNPPKPQPELQVATIIRKLALALEEAHQQGVVHRDIKPANIMIDKRREPIIMDFGLARSIAGPDEVRVTHDGAIVGTPAYMPPEQVKGDVDQVGPGADIYSLGVVMYELLTGQLPFSGSVTEVIARVLHDPPPKPSAIRTDLDGRLDAICVKMMSKAIGDRFLSMSEVATELSKYLHKPYDKPARKSSQQQRSDHSAMSPSPAQSDTKQPTPKAPGDFDPYHKWLGIPPKEQPPNHYRLLAIELFETDLDVIEAAAVSRSTYVRQCATGPHANASQEVLNRLSEAEICLLNLEKKAVYDAQLKSELAANVKQKADEKRAESSSETVSSGKKAKQSVDPKLAQLTQKLDKQKAHVESLLDKCEFAAAIDALEKLAAVKNPKAAKHVKWAKQQLPKAKRGTQEMRESSAAMVRTATDLYERNDFEEAAEILQQIPQKYRDAETRELLQECLDIQEEISALQDDIDHAESIGKYGDLQPTVERLLELKPNDHRARKLLKELKTYGKGGGMRLGGRGDTRFDAAGNTSSPVKVALCVVVPLVLFAIVGYATVVYVRSNNKTIKIEIDDPTAKVIIDGETVEITGVGDTIKLKVGKHNLTVERDDLVVETREFEVVKGKNSALRITLLGKEGKPLPPDVPVIAESGGTDTLTDALPITIAAKEERGYQIGAVKSGTELQIQYVSGKWKGWGSRADISPDNTTGRGGDSCLLALVDFPKGDATTGKVLKLIPQGTAQKPFSFVLPQNAENLVLRINDRGDGWAGNPGSVQYKVLVGGQSLGGVTSRSAESGSDSVAAVDLLKQIDVARDSIQGKWQITNGALLSPATGQTFLHVPHKLPAEYRLTATIERLSGTNYVGFGLMAGDNSFYAAIDDIGSTLTTLGLVAGTPMQQKEATHKGPVLRKNGASSVTIDVRTSGVLVTCDGRKIIDYKSGSDKFSLPGHWPVRKVGDLFVTTNDGKFRISRLEIQTLPLASPSPPSASQSKDFVEVRLTGRIDGLDEVRISQKGADWNHRKSGWPAELRLNGKRWAPQNNKLYPNSGTSKFLPADVRFEDATVTVHKGRGAFYFEKNVDRVYLAFKDDNRGADLYDVTFRMPVGSAPSKSIVRPGIAAIRVSGTVDGNQELRLYKDGANWNSRQLAAPKRFTINGKTWNPLASKTYANSGNTRYMPDSVRFQDATFTIHEGRGPIFFRRLADHVYVNVNDDKPGADVYDVTIQIPSD